jgi:hypothetical protein
MESSKPTKPTKKHREYGGQKTMKFSVAGMSYRLTPAFMEQLSEQTPIDCYFEREPENEHDENAVKILLQRWQAGWHIGYVPRDVAAKLAPLIDSGKIQISSVWLVKVHTATFGGDLVIGFRKKIS